MALWAEGRAAKGLIPMLGIREYQSRCFGFENPNLATGAAFAVPWLISKETPMPTIKSKSTRKGSKNGRSLTGRKKVQRRPKKVRAIKKTKPLARPLPLATVALYYWGVSYSIVSY